MKVTRSIATTSTALAAATAAAVGLSVAPARAADTTIVGGQPASSSYIVQLEFTQNGGTYGCTGEAISAQWILTARHCTEGDTSMTVYYSNSTWDRGPGHPADAVYNSPNGDVGLVHLADPAPLTSYAPLATSYTPRRGDRGTIYGYGARANMRPSDQLYKASVTVLGTSRDAYWGPAIHVRGVDGASNHGDSGGPLFVNGRVVGVCSTGDTSDPGSDINAGSNYANLTASRSWIRSRTGV